MRVFGIGLGTENKKLGSVFNFSLPSGITCPGMSVWCKKKCYATRYERRRPGCRTGYQRNLALVQDPDRFAELMIGVLPRILPCFRIHVSGDFHCPAYIQAWRRICTAFPQTCFWAYTRSWVAPDLIQPLKRLQQISNMQLFASVDPSMPLPPEGWRIAFVDSDPRATGYACEQSGQSEHSCLDCGYCFLPSKSHVILRVR